VISLSVQLDRAGSPHDHHRLIDLNDRAYRMFLRAKLRMLVELHEIEADKANGG
jgi:hypothetical protein